MKKNKKNNKKQRGKISKKKNLSIINHGDVVVIRNRSTIAAGVLGVLFLGVCAAGVYTLRDAWELPLFWLVFGAIVAGVVYSFAKMLISKIVLDSPEMTMTVYSPFLSKYKFEDINYIDQRTEKGSDGIILNVVTAYIGDGRRSVEIVSFSKDQADEVTALLRGMLDNGAMIYPEGDEEPFDLDDKGGVFGFIRRRREKKEEISEANSKEDGDNTDRTSKDAEKGTDKSKEEAEDDASDDDKEIDEYARSFLKKSR